jgi:hypothetical protein
MGYATTRTSERVAAAMGLLAWAPARFQAACDVPKGGVLLALPALLAAGLLRHTAALYTLPNGFYGIVSIFLLLALMALARIKSIEQLRYVAPGEWGNLLGLDRIPEVRTLRQKLEILCQQAGRAVRWNTALAQEWIAGQCESELIFYTDGHVRVYSGDLTPLPRHYVAQERLCLRGTTDYWINAMDGQPIFFVNKAVDPGLLATLRQDLVPWLETHAPASAELQQRMQQDPHQHTLDSQILAKTETRRRQLALFGAVDLESSLAQPEVTRYQHKKAHLRDEIESLNREIDELKKQRKETPHHIPVKDLPESDRFSRLLTERKHFIDTIKRIAYRAETSMALLLRDKLNREEDTRALLRQI